MVNAALTDLVAMRDHRAVLVAEGTLHKIVIEMTQHSLDVVILSELHIGITEFIKAPAESRSRVILRHTEFHMVTGIVHTAGHIDRAVAVRIQDILVLVHEFLRQVRTAALDGIAVPRHHRHMGIIGVAVIAPGQACVLTDLRAAHIGIVKIDRILQCACVVDLHPGILDRRIRRNDRLRQRCGRYGKCRTERCSDQTFDLHNELPP